MARELLLLSVVCLASSEPVTLRVDGQIEVDPNWNYVPPALRTKEEYEESLHPKAVSISKTVSHKTTTKETTTTTTEDPVVELIKSFDFDNVLRRNSNPNKFRTLASPEQSSELSVWKPKSKAKDYILSAQSKGKKSHKKQYSFVYKSDTTIKSQKKKKKSKSNDSDRDNTITTSTTLVTKSKLLDFVKSLRANPKPPKPSKPRSKAAVIKDFVENLRAKQKPSSKKPKSHMTSKKKHRAKEEHKPRSVTVPIVSDEEFSKEAPIISKEEFSKEVPIVSKEKVPKKVKIVSHEEFSKEESNRKQQKRHTTKKYKNNVASIYNLLKYSLEQPEDHYTALKIFSTPKPAEPEPHITVYVTPPDEKLKEINTAGFVKDNAKIKDFILKVFQQHLEMFKKMKSMHKDDPIARQKIDLAAISYSSKFADFVNDTQNRKIVTRLGKQKVILNTIETSNRIINRLLSFLQKDLEDSYSMRTVKSLPSIAEWQEQVRKGEKKQYKTACKMFRICRSGNAFSNFLSDFFTILLQVDDVKLKRAMDSLTEAISSSDLSQVVSKKLSKQIEASLVTIEQLDATQLRPSVWLFKNMLANKNQPLVLQPNYDQGAVNKSLAFMALIDCLDKRIPATEKNIIVMNNMKQEMFLWSQGQRDDVQEVIQSLVEFVYTNALSRIGDEEDSFEDNLRTLLNKKKVYDY